MKMAEKFMFVNADVQDGAVFTAEETDTGDYRISWLDDGHSNFKTVPYDRDSVYSNIISGAWLIREVFVKEQPSLEPSDDIVQASWPFPVSTVVGVNAVEPEFLPPDDIESIADYGITLADARESIRGLQSVGWVVEVCADFYTVRQDDDVYANKFVANTEADLAAIFQAIRTLDRFVDRG
jgi:hypothetical protein